MKYLFIRLLVIAVSVVTDIARKSEDLTAVSGYPLAEFLYQRVRTAPRLLTFKPKFTSNDDKQRVCHYITNSGYFQGSGRKPVFMHQIYDELRSKYRGIFHTLYVRPTYPQLTLPSDRGMIYNNRTRMINVVYEYSEIMRSEAEYAFLCLVRRTSDGTITKLLVSEEYNLSDTPSENHIAGRFVWGFEGNDANFSYLVSVAEEPAKVYSKREGDAERLYLQRRKGQERAADLSEDPLCTLNRYERLRLCTLIFSSDHFDKELEFTPTEDSVDDTICFDIQVAFREHDVRLEAGAKDYDEWVIGCKPTHYYSNYQSEYYISKAYSPGEVFVFRQANLDEIFIENLFTNIRFKLS